MIKKDDIWKSLTKYRYSKERNEVKYHTDFRLTEGNKIENYDELMKVFKEIVPQGKEWRIHFEMAVETFPLNKEDSKVGLS